MLTFLPALVIVDRGDASADPAEHRQGIYVPETMGVHRKSQGREAVFGSAQSILPVLGQIRREEHSSLHPLHARRLMTYYIGPMEPLRILCT